MGLVVTVACIILTKYSCRTLIGWLIIIRIVTNCQSIPQDMQSFGNDNTYCPVAEVPHSPHARGWGYMDKDDYLYFRHEH